MNKLQCCVIDDEPLAARIIDSYIQKTPFMQSAGVYHSAQDGIRTLLGGGIDVAFLDIQMPQLSGVELARVIPAGTGIVFTTAFENYAVQAFRLGALDYLLKPVSYDEFLGAARKALQWAELRQRAAEPGGRRDYLVVKSDYKLYQIPVADILYIEGLKDYVKVYVDPDTPLGRSYRSIVSLMSMRSLEERLPADTFMRVHRSYIVNTSKIQMVQRGRISLGPDTSVPISDGCRPAFMKFLEARTVGGPGTGLDV